MAKKAKDTPIVGQKIVQIRAMTKEEIEREGWDGLMGHTDPAVLVLEDGTTLFPGMDSEGNGPGCFYGHKGKTSFFLFGNDQAATAPHVADAAKA